MRPGSQPKGREGKAARAAGRPRPELGRRPRRAPVTGRADTRGPLGAAPVGLLVLAAVMTGRPRPWKWGPAELGWHLRPPGPQTQHLASRGASPRSPDPSALGAQRPALTHMGLRLP